MKSNISFIAAMVALSVVSVSAATAFVYITRSFTLRTMSAPAQIYVLCARDNDRDRLECARIVKDMR